MLATHAMSEGSQAIFYLAAFILFVVAAVLAYMGKLVYATCIAAGLALFVFVFFWNALAAS
jgi:hypothetical protein